MKNTIQKLFDFISAAERSRKYLPNTATNHKSPLRLIEPELNEEEGNSFDSFKNNLEQIFHIVYDKNQHKMSATSVEVYKRRVKSLIADYEKYGSDPGKMAAWNREIVIRKKKKQEDSQIIEPTKITEVSYTNTKAMGEEGEMRKHEEPLGGSYKAIILTPPNLTADQFERIQKYINYLRTTVVKDKAATEQFQKQDNESEGD